MSTIRKLVIVAFIFFTLLYGIPKTFELAGYQVRYNYCFGKLPIPCGWRIKLFTIRT
jgi:hypothetical protein